MPGDAAAHTNATVLVGAYLVLCLRWSTQRVSAELGPAEAQRKFPCSWARVDEPEARVMSASDCWAGLELARENGWLASDLFTDSIKYNIWLNNYTHMLAAYDAAWLAPGTLLVSADPTTTSFDPNPATCSEVFPSKATAEKVGFESEFDSWEAPNMQIKEKTNVKVLQVRAPGQSLNVLPGQPRFSSKDGIASDTTSRTASKEEHEPAMVGREVEDDACSTDTVAKEYVSGPAPLILSDRSACSKPKAFVSFLQDCNVGLVIRTNFANEPGMTKEYDASAMSSYGIEHKNIFVDDHKGGMPDRYSVETALQSVSGDIFEEEEAVLVHCKGGFGRSVVLACCVLIVRLDIPGSALLGWARLCRPGAVTSIKQEQFLRSMRGREDLRRYARYYGGSGGSSNASSNSACGCCVQ
jgi:hypothetical protein